MVTLSPVCFFEKIFRHNAFDFQRIVAAIRATQERLNHRAAGAAGTERSQIGGGCSKRDQRKGRTKRTTLTSAKATDLLLGADAHSCSPPLPYKCVRRSNLLVALIHSGAYTRSGAQLQWITGGVDHWGLTSTHHLHKGG